MASMIQKPGRSQRRPRNGFTPFSLFSPLCQYGQAQGTRPVRMAFAENLSIRIDEYRRNSKSKCPSPGSENLGDSYDAFPPKNCLRKFGLQFSEVRPPTAASYAAVPPDWGLSLPYRTQFQIPPEEIIHFRMFNPWDPYTSGISPLQATFEFVNVAEKMLGHTQAAHTQFTVIGTGPTSQRFRSMSCLRQVRTASNIGVGRSGSTCASSAVLRGHHRRGRSAS